MDIQITLRKLVSKEFRRAFARAIDEWATIEEAFILFSMRKTFNERELDYGTLLDVVFYRTGLDVEDVGPEARKYKEIIAALLDKTFPLSIPQLLIITPDHIKRGLTTEECLILAPILDLTNIEVKSILSKSLQAPQRKSSSSL